MQVGVPSGDRVVLIRNPRSTAVPVDVVPGTPFSPDTFSFELGGATRPTLLAHVQPMTEAIRRLKARLISSSSQADSSRPRG